MTEANEEVLNYIQSYYEGHGKRPSVKNIYENLENVSKRRFYESFPDGIGSACELLGIPIDQKKIDSTKKARKTKKDKPRISEDAERIREDKEILALKPEIFKLMRISGVGTPGEALRKAEATAIAMNPWVVNRGVKTAPELISLLIKERGDAINTANLWKVDSESWKAKSEVYKKELDKVAEAVKEGCKKWEEIHNNLKNTASSESNAIKVLGISPVTRVFYTYVCSLGGSPSYGEFINSVVEKVMQDRGFECDQVGQKIQLYHDGEAIKAYYIR